MNSLMYLLIVVIFSCAFSADPEIKIGSCTTRVKGHSGKITLECEKKTTNSDYVDNSGEVILETIIWDLDFSTLRERDSQGVEVGKSGTRKHTFNNFAQLDFTFTTVAETKYQGLSATTFSFNTQANGADLKIDIFLFTQDGNLTIGNTLTKETETLAVTKGSLKFNVNITGWTFCSAPADSCDPKTDNSCCKDGNTYQTGSVLELEIILTRRNASNSKVEIETLLLDNVQYLDFNRLLANTDLADSTHKFNDGVLSTPCLYIKDDTWTKMSTCPTVSNEGLILFRFEKFNKNIIYDPILSLNTGDGSGKFLAYLFGLNILLLALLF